MGYEENKKNLLNLSYLELQCLCKKHNLPANKTHSLLATSLASLLEASPGTSPVPLAVAKKTSTGNQANNKRGPYSCTDDRPLVNAKHQKGFQTPVDEVSKRGFDTSASISPVSINYGRSDCHGHSSSEQENPHNLQLHTVGIAFKSTNPELASEHHRSPANVIDQICPPIIEKPGQLIPSFKHTPYSHMEDTIDKGCGPSDKISANSTPVQFYVMSDEGIDLVVDLDSTPATWAKNFMGEMCIPPSSEPGNFSSVISSLVSNKDDQSTASPSGNIIVDIQSKGAENIVPSTNSSLASDGENSRSESHPTDTIIVNSVSSAFTLAGTQVELSGYQGGVPVMSSCLTSDNHNSMTSDMMMAGASDSVLVPLESFDVSMRSERIVTPLVDASVQPTGNRITRSPCKTKVFGKADYSQGVSVADTDNLSAFSLRDAAKSDSNENCPKSSGKQNADISAGSQPAHSGDVPEILMEDERMEAVAVEETIGCDDSFSVSCQLANQTVAKLPVTDAQSHASSAYRCIVGSFDLMNPTSSSAASDNAINSLTSKYVSESAQSHDSTDKRKKCDAEELGELESMTPPAYSQPPRNIQLSLRSASARQAKPLPRRSARLVPK